MAARETNLPAQFYPPPKTDGIKGRNDGTPGRAAYGGMVSRQNPTTITPTKRGGGKKPQKR